MPDIPPKDPSNPLLDALSWRERVVLLATDHRGPLLRVAIYLILGLAAVLSLRCYGAERERQGATLVRSQMADSLATILQTTAHAIADSALIQIRAANARADSAIQRQQRAEQTATAAQVQASSVLARANQLQPQVIATLPVEVRTILVELQASNTKLSASLTEMAATATDLRHALDTTRVAAEHWRAAYVSADSSATTYHREALELRSVKTPRFGFQAGVLAGAGLVLTAAVGLITLRSH